MAWFRIDDRFADHPKVVEAGNAAVGLWVRCGAYSSGYLLDGVVPASVARGYGSRREVQALIVARLWVPADNGGFLMPDFLDYNPSAEAVKAVRKREAEKKRRQRAAGAAEVDHGSNGQFTSRSPSPGDRS